MLCTQAVSTESYRVLIVDDNRAIHDDFRKILQVRPLHQPVLEEAAALLFDEDPTCPRGPLFELECALQGQEGLELVRRAKICGRPFALAFLDIRMPPGWDGIETAGRLWEECPDLQIVICTAYSDYSWDSIMGRLSRPDQFLILKKPFDTLEVRQLAHALATKWSLAQQVNRKLGDLQVLVERRTERLRRTNQQLRRSLSQLRATLEATADGILVVDATGVVAGCNQKYMGLVGLASQALSGRLHVEHMQATRHLLTDADAAIDRTVKVYTEPEAESFDVLELTDGRCFERYSRPQRLHGVTVGRVWSFRDVTSRVALEHQLRESQKLEAVGQLAAGVAHDFNNLLTVIMGNSNLLTSDPAIPEKNAKQVDQISQAAERAANLTRQLLQFSSKQPMRPSPLRIQDLIESMARMLERLLGADVVLRTVCSGPLPTIDADRGMIEQVLMNLAVNARDAMPQGGTLTIEAVPETRTAPGSATPAPCVCLAVRDTGSGIEPAVLDSMFNPFFTTKEAGKGTGLGLSTVHGIVKQHHGWIEVETELGRGSAFKVYIPAGVATSEKEVSQPRVAVPHPGNETVLVVEDEAAVRDLLRVALERIGYRVLVATSAVEALPVWERHRHEIALLITDLVMPGGMNGIQLAQRLRADRSSVKVLYTSGYSPDLVSANGLLREGVNFLSKPFTPIDLSRVVRAALDGDPVWRR